MAGDKDKKKKRSSKKGSKDRAKSRAKPLDAEAFGFWLKGAFGALGLWTELGCLLGLRGGS